MTLDDVINFVKKRGFWNTFRILSQCKNNRTEIHIFYQKLNEFSYYNSFLRIKEKLIERGLIAIERIFRYLDNVKEFFQEKNIVKFTEILKQNGKKVEDHLEFELISFEFIDLKLKVQVFERKNQVHIDFEEGKQPILSFEID